MTAGKVPQEVEGRLGKNGHETWQISPQSVFHIPTDPSPPGKTPRSPIYGRATRSFLFSLQNSRDPSFAWLSSGLCVYPLPVSVGPVVPRVLVRF
jgi:hypothetical protein